MTCGWREYFQRLDIQAVFLQPFDRGLDIFARGVHFRADVADFVGGITATQSTA
jgi:hypothetical protein